MNTPRISFGCTLALALSLTTTANGVLAVFDDRSAWEGATPGTISTETFSSVPVDTEFVTSPVQLSGFSLQAGDLPADNFIDVPPANSVLGLIDGATARADNIGGITFTFDEPVTAWGADYASLGPASVNDFTVTLTDSSTIMFEAPDGFSSGFLGFTLGPGQAAVRLEYTTTNAPGTSPGGSDFGDDHLLDNVSLRAIPEPSVWPVFAVLVIARAATRASTPD